MNAFVGIGKYICESQSEWLWYVTDMDKFLLEKKDILWLLFQESYIPAADRQGNNNPLQNGLLEFVQMLVRYLLFKIEGFYLLVCYVYHSFSPVFSNFYIKIMLFCKVKEALALSKHSSIMMIDKFSFSR